MIDCTPTIIPWADASIAWVATHIRHAFLTPSMLAITSLGYSTYSMIVIAFSYWIINKNIGKYLCYTFVASLFLNVWIKGIVMECRPPTQFWLDGNPISYSFPSGHAQGSILLWGALAYYARSMPIAILCILIGLLIGISRIYLGMHYPHDVLVGFILGSMMLYIGVQCEKKQFAPMKNLPLWIQGAIILSLFTFASYMINDPERLDIPSSAACFGFWVGYHLESRYLNFSASRHPLALVLQLFIGIGGLFLLKNTFSTWGNTLSPEQALLFKYPQYFILGIWITFAAPWIFAKSKISSLGSSSSQPTARA